MKESRRNGKNEGRRYMVTDRRRTGGSGRRGSQSVRESGGKCAVGK